MSIARMSTHDAGSGARSGVIAMKTEITYKSSLLLFSRHSKNAITDNNIFNIGIEFDIMTNEAIMMSDIPCGACNATPLPLTLSGCGTCHGPDLGAFDVGALIENIPWKWMLGTFLVSSALTAKLVWSVAASRTKSEIATELLEQKTGADRRRKKRTRRKKKRTRKRRKRRR